MSHKLKYYALTVASIVQVGLLGINLLITSQMPISERGIYALITAILITVSSICSFGFLSALIKRLHNGFISKSYLLLVVLIIFMQSIIAIIVSLLLLSSLPSIDMDVLFDNRYILVSLTVSLIMRGYLQSILVGLNRISEFQMSKIFPVIIFLVVLITRSEYTLWNVLFAWQISEGLLIIVLLAYTGRVLSIENNSSHRLFMNDIKFGVKSIFGQGPFIEVYKVDQILTGYFLSLSEVAIYAVAKSVSLVLRFIPQSLSQIAYPSILQAHENRRLSIIKTYIYFTVIVSVIAMVVGQYLFEQYVISYIGEEYRQAEVIVLLLFFGVLFYAPRRLVYEYLKAINLPSKTSLIELSVLSLYLIGVLILFSFDLINIINLVLVIFVVNLISATYTLRKFIYKGDSKGV
jgi:O-antigen/teichoic acid export membrane protein